MLNHIVIMGRLTRDPELRRTGSGLAVTSFSVAVDRDFGRNENGEKKTDFFDCVAWRNTAEYAAKYLTKGRMVVVSGRLEFRDWNDREGNKRRNAEVIVDNVYPADSRRDGDNGSAPAYGGNYGAPATPAYSGGYAAPAPAAASDFAMLDDDDAQLPF